MLQLKLDILNSYFIKVMQFAYIFDDTLQEKKV